jgi:hypothetical protein
MEEALAFKEQLKMSRAKSESFQAAIDILDEG